MTDLLELKPDGVQDRGLEKLGVDFRPKRPGMWIVLQLEGLDAAMWSVLRTFQQLRHLGHIDGDAPRLVARQQIV